MLALTDVRTQPLNPYGGNRSALFAIGLTEDSLGLRLSLTARPTQPIELSKAMQI